MAKETGNSKAEWNAVFNRAPDPWKEVVRLGYGEDGAFASAIEQAVRGASEAECVELEKRLLGVLAEEKCTQAARDFVCRMLALTGSASCAAALGPLLRDSRTADMARLVLEPIPGAAVDAALRDALPELRGSALLGLIGTLGIRRNATALPALEALKNSSEDAAVREAAERAITFIGQ